MLRILEHHEIQPYEVALVHWENEEINYTVGEYVDVCVSLFLFLSFPASNLKSFHLQGKHKARTRKLYSECQYGAARSRSGEICIF